MKIYKYKDLRPENNRKHFIDMVLENSVWCADPDSLNDEDEFRYKYDYRPTPHTVILLEEILKKTISPSSAWKARHVIENGLLQGIAEPIIDSLIGKARSEIGIASFSRFRNKSILWQRYGGNRYGVCIQYVIPDNLIGNTYHNVAYVSEKVFHIDTFYESYLDNSKVIDSYRNMLLTKTQSKWKCEAEVRLITSEQKIRQPVHGPITEILFGGNVPDSVYEEMMKSISSHCQQNDIRIARF